MTHLSCGNKNSSDNVGRVCIVASDGASHCRAHQILADVELHQCRHTCLQHLTTYNESIILSSCTYAHTLHATLHQPL